MSVNTVFWLDDRTPWPSVILHPTQTPDKTTSYLASSCIFFCIWTSVFLSWLIRKDSSKTLSISSRVQLNLKLNVFSRCDGERSSVPGCISYHDCVALLVNGLTHLRLRQHDTPLNVPPLNFVQTAWGLFMKFSLAIFGLSSPLSPLGGSSQ